MTVKSKWDNNRQTPMIPVVFQTYLPIEYCIDKYYKIFGSIKEKKTRSGCHEESKCEREWTLIHLIYVHIWMA